MALDVNTLKSEFLKVIDSTDPGFVGYPATTNQAAINWATAYNTYATAAVDLSSDVLISANFPGFISQLNNGLIPVGTIATAAAAFEAAFVAYWTGAVFAVGIPPVPIGPCPNIGGTLVFGLEITSVVSAIMPNVLNGLLLGEFGILSADATAKATSLAAAFHTATTTAVFVTIAGTDTTVPTPLPITNTCNIH